MGAGASFCCRLCGGKEGGLSWNSSILHSKKNRLLCIAWWKVGLFQRFIQQYWNLYKCLILTFIGIGGMKFIEPPACQALC